MCLPGDAEVDACRYFLFWKRKAKRTVAQLADPTPFENENKN